MRHFHLLSPSHLYLAGWLPDTCDWSAFMKRSLSKFGLIGAFALALSTASALAQPGNVGSLGQAQSSKAGGPLVQVRGDRYHSGNNHGGGFYGGRSYSGRSHGGNFRSYGGNFHGRRFHRRNFHKGVDVFVGPYYDDYDKCMWSRRYHRRICY
jgi:hypothetical protein